MDCVIAVQLVSRFVVYLMVNMHYFVISNSMIALIEVCCLTHEKTSVVSCKCADWGIETFDLEQRNTNGPPTSFTPLKPHGVGESSELVASLPSSHSASWCQMFPALAMHWHPLHHMM